MGITVFKDSADSTRTYLRITRAINGKEQQRYVRVEGNTKAAMQKAMKKAREIDQRLAQWQAAVRHLMTLRGERLIHEDGSIVGLQLQVRDREARGPSIEFKIRVKLPDKPAIFKSVSINRYGFDTAFDMALQRICELRDIPEDADAYAKMKACKDWYKERYDAIPNKPTPRFAPPKKAAPPGSRKKRSDAKAATAKEDKLLGQFTDWLKEEVGRFATAKPKK
ncbi:MAG: hypothetical protein D6758_07810 [Gammaproteobacteria bacterium]|nr:MAG: hypothetical protein D6758_07810 [Gammaproteobacteria bacterium]